MLSTALVVLLLAFVAAPAALADHPHWLSTPGRCVEDLGRGQTSISDPGHGGYHRFHENVHLGTPGTKAFENPNNPVSVGKGETCPS